MAVFFAMFRGILIAKPCAGLAEGRSRRLNVIVFAPSRGSPADFFAP